MVAQEEKSAIKRAVAICNEPPDGWDTSGMAQLRREKAPIGKRLIESIVRRSLPAPRVGDGFGCVRNVQLCVVCVFLKTNTHTSKSTIDLPASIMRSVVSTPIMRSRNAPLPSMCRVQCPADRAVTGAAAGSPRSSCTRTHARAPVPSRVQTARPAVLRAREPLAGVHDRAKKKNPNGNAEPIGSQTRS